MNTLIEDIEPSAEWIARALSSSGYRADFTPRSLWEIDRFFEEHSRDGASKPGGLLAEDRRATAVCGGLLYGRGRLSRVAGPFSGR
jgi:hypothetical protein